MAEFEYLTAKQAADLLGYTAQHVRRLLRAGDLDGHKQGRDWLIPEEAIRDFRSKREDLGLPLAGENGNPRK